MSDYTGLERLLGLPEGSTQGSTESEVAPVLTKGVKEKTNELEIRLQKADTLGDMAPSELVKNGLSMELLEADKVNMRNEAYEVYGIAKSILERFKEDIEERVDIGDRMYTAGSALISSVAGSLDKLNNMLMRFRQEEEIKGLAIIGEDDNNGSKQMSPQDWMAFVNEVRNEDDDSDDDSQPKGLVEDAEIIQETEDNV
jgi:hypothetical protein